MTLKNTCYFTILATIILSSLVLLVPINKATALSDAGVLPPLPIPLPVPIPIPEPLNNPPAATDDSATTQVNTSVTIDVLANDFDPDGDTISLESFDATSEFNGTITRDDNGTPQDLSDDNLIYTPPENAYGIDTFSYTISDGWGGTDSATVTITVQEPTSF